MAEYIEFVADHLLVELNCDKVGGLLYLGLSLFNFIQGPDPISLIPTVEFENWSIMILL